MWESPRESAGSKVSSQSLLLRPTLYRFVLYYVNSIDSTTHRVPALLEQTNRPRHTQAAADKLDSQFEAFTFFLQKRL
jgi:hypothetical protein